MKTIKTLTEFAQALDAGEEFEIELHGGDAWASAKFYATELAAIQKFIAEGAIRIKQKPQEIDMTPFTRNGLDCEFWDPKDDFQLIHTLGGIEDSGKYRYVSKSNGVYKNCRPRLNHPFIWSDNLELPDGLLVEYGFFNGEELEWSDIPKNAHLARILGCKENYCFAGEG